MQSIQICMQLINCINESDSQRQSACGLWHYQGMFSSSDDQIFTLGLHQVL